MSKRLLLAACVVFSSADAQSPTSPADGSELILDLGASAVRDVTVSNDGGQIVYTAEIDGNWDNLPGGGRHKRRYEHYQ